MTPAQKLAANPLTFLQKNIVIIGPQNPPASSNGVATFSLLHATERPELAELKESDRLEFAEKGTRKSGLFRQVKAADVYTLLPYNDQYPHSALQAYWCGYKDNSAQFQKVGSAANLMFTHTMTGCTFAVGSATPTGARLVGHFNIQINQEASESDMHSAAKQIFGSKAKLLEKSKYKAGDNEIRVTTFGFRKGGQWKFYYQRYRQQGIGMWDLLDVKQLTGNR